MLDSVLQWIYGAVLSSQPVTEIALVCLNQWGLRCVIAVRMINWSWDDELWIHPGSLAAGRRIDGAANEGNNEGSFRTNNRNICAALQLKVELGAYFMLLLQRQPFYTPLKDEAHLYTSPQLRDNGSQQAATKDRIQYNQCPITLLSDIFTME